jgi:hypothetical protein
MPDQTETIMTQARLEDILLRCITTCETHLKIDLHTLPILAPDVLPLFSEPLYGLGPKSRCETNYSIHDTSYGFLGALDAPLTPVDYNCQIDEITVYRMSLLCMAEFVRSGEDYAKYNEVGGMLFTVCTKLVKARGYAIQNRWNGKPAFLKEHHDVWLAESASEAHITKQIAYWRTVRDQDYPNVIFEH